VWGGAVRSGSSIVGLAFHLPRDLSDEHAYAFWRALKEGRDLTGQVPAGELSCDEWPNSGHGIIFFAGVLSRRTRSNPRQSSLSDAARLKLPPRVDRHAQRQNPSPLQPPIGADSSVRSWRKGAPSADPACS
jgi:hypothetical protein